MGTVRNELLPVVRGVFELDGETVSGAEHGAMGERAMNCDFCGAELCVQLAELDRVPRLAVVCAQCGCRTDVIGSGGAQSWRTFDGGASDADRTLTFAAGSPDRQYLRYGWGVPERWGVTATDAWCAFEAPIPETEAVTGFVITYAPPKTWVKSRPFALEVYAQDRFLGGDLAAIAGERQVHARFVLNGVACHGLALVELFQPHFEDPANGELREGLGLISCRVLASAMD